MQSSKIYGSSSSVFSVVYGICFICTMDETTSISLAFFIYVLLYLYYTCYGVSFFTPQGIKVINWIGTQYLPNLKLKTSGKHMRWVLSLRNFGGSYPPA